MKLKTTKKLADALNGFVGITFQCFTGGGASTTAKTITAKVNKGDGKDDVKVLVKLQEREGSPVGQAVSLQNMTRDKINRHVVRVAGNKIVLKKAIPEIQAIMQDAECRMDDIRDAIVSEYPAMRKRMIERMNKKKVNGDIVSDDVTFPSATEIASNFRMEQNFTGCTQALNHDALQGIGDEAAAQAIAESEAAIEQALLAGHGEPVQALRDVLAKFADMVRNAERLHPSQFDKLADELRRVRDLNALGVEEITEIIQTASHAVKGKASGADMSQSEREEIAKVADVAQGQCEDVLSSLGL